MKTKASMLQFHEHPHYKAHFERNVFDSFLMLRKTQSGFPQKKETGSLVIAGLPFTIATVYHKEPSPSSAIHKHKRFLVLCLGLTFVYHDKMA